MLFPHRSYVSCASHMSCHRLKFSSLGYLHGLSRFTVITLPRKALQGSYIILIFSRDTLPRPTGDMYMMTQAQGDQIFSAGRRDESGRYTPTEFVTSQPSHRRIAAPRATFGHDMPFGRLQHCQWFNYYLMSIWNWEVSNWKHRSFGQFGVVTGMLRCGTPWGPFQIYWITVTRRGPCERQSNWSYIIGLYTGIRMEEFL
ncbi:uncharacterized protein F5147DRAFT_757368 [Suillus discolor]|uniref:Uncharacterized protein n=1 Tax=Suillus discolor TaxID=1912936 RepID=A0A9P7FHQ3_9AGAM|nr:uncharacterized protein F5147DRAFT_757368 [Suillus discolor]KAG2118967.1 hypothetical protein F5147DRAFT_757368 [Suillus discolor]